MKKNYPQKIIKITTALTFLAAALFPMERNGSAFADSDANQVLAFKNIYIEPAKDNVDGAFKGIAEKAFRDIFERNPRFILVETSAKADAKVHAVLEKKTSGIDVEVILSLMPGNELFATTKTTIPSTAPDYDIRTAIKELLKADLKKIPFYGTITGKDGKEVTLDIGSAHGLRVGDIVQVERIGNIKRHPLLKSVLDVQMVPVGSLQIDQVEETISFAHVHQEAVGEKIQELYKVTAIRARPHQDEKGLPHEEEPNSVYFPIEHKNSPKLGFIHIGAYIGGFYSTSSVTSPSEVGYTGSALAPGAKLGGELWLTKRWFVDAWLGANFMSYSHYNSANPPEDGVTLPEYSSSSRSFNTNLGFRFLFDGKFYDKEDAGNPLTSPQVFVRAGYRSFKWDTVIFAGELLSPKTYSGVNVGVGTQLPFRNLDYGVVANIDMLLFSSISESGYITGSAGTAGVSGIQFYLAAYHYFTPQIALRAGIQFESYSADFGEETTSASSTHQKQLGFLPSILYYF